MRLNFPVEATGLANVRNELHRSNATDPTDNEDPQMNSVDHNRLVQEYKRKKWLNHLECFNIGADWLQLARLSEVLQN